MWKDTPLDSSGFEDVDGDVEMMIAPEVYPLSCRNRKRKYDEDEISVRVLIDSITYVSKVDVRQERKWQSLSSLNRMVVRVNVNFERRSVVWIESWL